MKRRPNYWDGALPQFKGAGSDYEVLTLIARDGVHPSNPKGLTNDFSAKSLKTSGYALRNYLTLISYSRVIERVCQVSEVRK